MKKILLVLPALFTLISCGETSNLWSDQDEEIMKTHLNNNLLPYISLDGIGATYNREKKCVSITATEEISEDKMKKYGQYVENDGYTKIEEECLKEDFTSKGFYTYSKSVNQGIIYIDVYSIMGGSYNLSGGEFHVDAYFYEITVGEQEPITWTVVDERIMTTYLQGTILPYCDIANNVVTFSEYETPHEDPNEKGTVIITAPYATSNEVANYLTTLKETGFEEITLDEKYIYEVKKTINENYDLYVQLYTYTDEGYLADSGEFYADAWIQKR